ncbi:helix-turn-helix transcriptional regulator [Chelonobacter oris]|nr:PAS domain-containing protein [Chelonobacter oris]
MMEEFIYLNNPKDQKIMASYFSLADSIAELLGKQCEIVIHSVTNFENSIIKIINGYHTNRKVGDPITDKGLQLLKHYQQHHADSERCYFSHLPSGDLIKSTTHIIIGSQGEPIGIFCINLNLSYPLDKIITSLMPKYEFLTPQKNETFTTTPQELIENTINNAIIEVEKKLPKNSKSYKKSIIRYLVDNGIFELKDAISQVSKKLNITPHAIYKHLRELKK